MAGAGDVVTQHIEAFNGRDRDSEPWAATAELVAPVGSVSGRDEVLGFLGVFQEAFPDGRLEVGRLLVDGSSAAAEGKFVGTHDGILHSPDGDIAPTGKAVEFRWAAAYEVSGAALTSEHLYFDQMDLLGQLGLLRADQGRSGFCLGGPLRLSGNSDWLGLNLRHDRRRGTAFATGCIVRYVR